MALFDCPCGQRFDVPPHLFGQTVACPRCGAPLIAVAGAAPTFQAVKPTRPPSQIANSPARGMSGAAIAALATGIAAVVTCVIPSLTYFVPYTLAGVAGLMGVIGLMGTADGRRSGFGLAAAGLILAICGAGIAGYYHYRTWSALHAIAEAFGGRGAKARSDEAGKTGPKVVWATSEKTSAFKTAEVTIRSAEIAPVPLKRMGEVVDGEDALLIRIAITNSSPTKKLHYGGWSGAGLSLSAPPAELTDEHGNHYRHIVSGFASRIEGQQFSEEIYPGKSLDDLLAFEVPVPAAKTLSLQLPGETVGSGVDVGFRLSAPKQ